MSRTESESMCQNFNNYEIQIKHFKSTYMSGTYHKVSKKINSNEVHIYWEIGIKSSVQVLNRSI